MIDLTPIMQAIITLAATVITVMVVPFIKSKTTAEQQAQMRAWAKIGVNAAEQIYRGPGRGEDKKQYVSKFLEQRGYTLDLAQLDALIESMVNQTSKKQEQLTQEVVDNE